MIRFYLRRLGFWLRHLLQNGSYLLLLIIALPQLIEPKHMFRYLLDLVHVNS